jgi:hypothetical protein
MISDVDDNDDDEDVVGDGATSGTSSGTSTASSASLPPTTPSNRHLMYLKKKPPNNDAFVCILFLLQRYLSSSSIKFEDAARDESDNAEVPLVVVDDDGVVVVEDESEIVATDDAWHEQKSNIIFKTSPSLPHRCIPTGPRERVVNRMALTRALLGSRMRTDAIEIACVDATHARYRIDKTLMNKSQRIYSTNTIPNECVAAVSHRRSTTTTSVAPVRFRRAPRAGAARRPRRSHRATPRSCARLGRIQHNRY